MYKITITKLEDYEGKDGNTYTRTNDVYTQTVEDVDMPALVNFINRSKDVDIPALVNFINRPKEATTTTV